MMHAMDLGLRDRVAIVTGASRGIGKQIALGFAREGAHVVLSARDADVLDTTAHEVAAHGVRAVRVVADLTDPAAAELLAERALEELDRIDILVNNMGGGGEPARLHRLTQSDWYEGFERNFFSAVRTTSACVPTMLERGWGRVVHIASTYGVEPGPYFGPYSAAKAALLNYSKNVARAYSAQGVCSNCVIPGVTLTESVDARAEVAAAAQGTSAEEVMATLMQRDPVAMGRYGDPHEVAGAAVFLASEAASWITGAALAVDGGTLRSV
jgi:NAD(P)-dependent dehydrogenase (short-subunit alcohol dehydrogenase family)